jgi:hypothetical protein
MEENPNLAYIELLQKPFQSNLITPAFLKEKKEKVGFV